MQQAKYGNLVKKLENDELEQNNVGEELYIQLFALYLYQDELVEAKLLWKRISPELKAESKELEHLQILLRALLNNNWAEFFKNVNYNWSDNIIDVMDDFREKMRSDIFVLVGQAYTSIFEHPLIQLTQLSPEELKETCMKLGWTYELDAVQTLVIPKRPPNIQRACTSSEGQLFKLTDFVSFLEN